MKITGLHHVALYTKDMEKSLRFYIGGLGGKETFRFPKGGTGPDIVLVDVGGGAVLEIIPGGVEEPESNARFAHLCVLAEDVREAYETAIRAGAVSRSEPNDAMLGSMPVTNAFVYGPDGEVLEFFKVRA